jgi:hypothetical protein
MRHTWAVSDRAPAFARDAATAAYYEQRAKEYDEWYLSQGRFESLNPPAWHLEVSHLVDLRMSPIAVDKHEECRPGRQRCPFGSGGELT